MQNGGDEIDWENRKQYKYYIYYNHISNKYDIDYDGFGQDFGVVYFTSREVVQRAIEEIVKPFCEKHPDFEF